MRFFFLIVTSVLNDVIDSLEISTYIGTGRRRF